METVILVGFFRELAHGLPDGPSLLASIKEGPWAQQDELVRYLERGHLFVAMPGVVYDVMADGTLSIGSGSILTDGRFAWPEDLAYYVKTYNARLPAEVLNAIAANDFKMPGSVDVERLQWPD